MLSIKWPVNYISSEPRCCKTGVTCTATTTTEEPVEKLKPDSLFIDKRGKLRSFNRKRVSRQKGGSLRGKGWQYGSGFVDGIFPVLSPIAQKVLNYVRKEVDVHRVWSSLDTLPHSNNTWDDLINVAVQLWLNKQWDPIIQVCEWILYRSSFQPDIICYNLLIDAYGQKSLIKKAESIYVELLEAHCIPTEDTYALLTKAYCTSGQLEKAEAIFTEMRQHGLPPSTVVYNAYIDGLMKLRKAPKALEIFQRMERDHCQPSTDTYTMLINLYGKVKSYTWFIMPLDPSSFGVIPLDAIIFWEFKSSFSTLSVSICSTTRGINSAEKKFLRFHTCKLK
ncbi:pentatricopeptide repeat-containing protein At2g35130-like [Coffea eugenioides]|uniref:pentatricopeptide repeat-containing protein At2g35130-like n=1 Tax=Coffea eugenioides TaxID=49369 RepID=UPI000F612492|nr:pentatricopeptide repeat-containing protein At2g35130-like [Coffea eugenioides]